MRVAIRADASSTIGAGHVVRCLAIADALRRSGCDVTFLTRPRPGDLRDRIRAAGHAVIELAPANDREVAGTSGLWLGTSEERDAAETLDALRSWGEPVSWLIADSFGIGASWETRVRPAVSRILTIDDRLENPRACDALLYPQALTDTARHTLERYASHGIRIFGGTQFVILSERVERARHRASRRTGSLRNVLIAFGGATDERLAVASVRAVRGAGVAAQIHLVMGRRASDPIGAALAGVADLRFYDHVDAIEELYARCDLAIGSDGIMLFERALLGLPAIVIPVETHWAWSAREMERQGCVLVLNDAPHVEEAEIIHAAAASNQPGALESLSAACLQFMEPYEPLDGGALLRFLITPE
jgi:UDP-2,4-diacetamido-2,4,6-trideoxy-beta-L-altropyranose hydrolase